jgi:hypothetical protein
MRARSIAWVLGVAAACADPGDARDAGTDPGGSEATSDPPATSEATGSDSSGLVTTSSSGLDSSSSSDESTGEMSPMGWTPQLDGWDLHCKLISDESVEDPTANATHTRFNLRGTDLGIPVEIDGALHLFFGDTHGYRVIWAPGEDPDSVAFVDAAAVAADPTVLCSQLQFYVTPDVPSVAAGVDASIERDFAGGFMVPPRGESIDTYVLNHPEPFPNIPGSFEVPAGALAIDDALYLFWAGRAEFDPYARMTLSYLARWDAPRDLPTYQIVRPIDSMYDGALGGHFMQILPFVVDDAVYMLGTGEYRRSGVYLARVPLRGLESGTGQEVWDPIARAWVEPTAAIEPMFDSDGVGELGGVFVPGPDVFAVMYQRELHGAGGAITDNRIVLRTAPHPTGPWSDAVTIIDMADPAFQAAHCCGTTCVGDQILHCNSAGLYGSYVLPYPVVTPQRDGAMLVELPFLASTWNPYNVALFEARVLLQPTSE